MMETAAGWIAPAATMIAAMMTAANLGARVTGWGFIIFTIGSICWSIVGLSTGQSNLLWTNGFLTAVNAIGIWRWLGRQAKYDDGGAAAAHKSAGANVPSLFSTGALSGAAVIGSDGSRIGTVIDGMARCDGAALAYGVVSEGGVGGVGERLHAIDPRLLIFGHEGVSTKLTAEDLMAMPVIEPDHWPEKLPD